MFRAFPLSLVLALSALPAFANDGVLDVAAPFEIKGPDPVLSGDIFLKMDVVETLVGADAAGTLQPALATKWAPSNDGLVWTFTLRSGVRFHDGSEMDAEAVALSLNRARANGATLSKAPITDIRATPAGTVEIVLSQPFAVLPAMMAEYSSGIVALTDGAVDTLIGTGPYSVTEMSPPNQMRVTAYEGYWGQTAVIPDAIYHAVSRAETRALMAESGDAEITLTLDPASVSRLSGTPDITVHSEPTPRVLLLKVNAETYDLPTRQALSMAIDREGIARAVLRFPAGATQMFPPGMSDWHNPALPALTYDPEGAKAALADAGWTVGADGILQRGGQPLRIELLTYPDRPELPLVAAVLEQQFAAIGAAVIINSANFSEIPAKHADGTLSTALFARNFALTPDPVGTLVQDYAPTGDWGAMGWSNPDFTAGVQALAAGTAPEGTRATLVATLHAELPVLPIAWYQLTMAVSNRVSGVVVDPFERTLGLASVKWAD